jgi:exopolysaccharide biosynthesis operon protein EpsL
MPSPTARSARGFSLPEAGATGKRTIAIISAGLLLLTPGCASALFQDAVEIWASLNSTHDSNVLRLSKNLSPESVGAPGLGDTFNTLKVGAAADIPVSLQRIQAAFTWQRTRYNSFTNLDFDGHVATLNWAWVIDHRFYGSIGASDSKGLASFSNIQRNAQDLVTTRLANATGNWRVTPEWRASAAVNWGKSEHSDPLRAANNVETTSLEGGLAYVTPEENTVAGIVRFEHGKRPPTSDVVGALVDNTYRQSGVGATAAWAFNPHSRLDGNLVFIRRTYDADTRRNFSGLTGRAVYTWTPTPKITVASALYRDIGPSDDVTTSFVLANGAYIRPRWDATEKISIQGNVEYDRFDFHGDPLHPTDFSHRLRTYGASALYRPTRKSMVSAGVNREIRTSDLPLADYDAKVIFIEGRIGF